MMLYYPTPSSGKLTIPWFLNTFQCIPHISARRNERGHLEPDAPQDAIRESLGFSNYEHAAKAEVFDAHPDQPSDTKKTPA